MTATATEMTLEARVAALETAVAQLQRRLPQADPDWVEKISGSISDPEAFAELLRLGREAREADRNEQPES